MHGVPEHELARIGAEGRDLDDVVVGEDHVDEPEAPPDDATVREDPPHLPRARRRDDVEVLRVSAEEEVAHAAADEVGLVAESPEAADDLQGLGVDLFVRDLVRRDDLGLRGHLR